MKPLISMKKNVLMKCVICVFFASIFLFAPVSHAQNSQEVWQKHLEYLKNDAGKDCVGDLTQLKLLKYAYKGKIRSEKDKSQVIKAFYSDKAPIVSVSSNLVISDTTYTDTDITIHQKIYPNFEIATVRQMLNTGKLTQDSIATIKQRLYKNVGIGFGYVKLIWIYKGKKFRTLGIISNDDILADPITARLFTRGKTITNCLHPINDEL